MRVSQLIDLCIADYNRSMRDLSTKSGKWHPTGSRRRKAEARRQRRRDMLVRRAFDAFWSMS